MSKSALVVWGGWDGHEPKQCADVFVPWLKEQGFEVEVHDTLECYLDRDHLKSLSLIMPIWTMGEITPDQEKNLLEAVKSGVGIAGWHGGMGDSFRKNTEYQFMVGGQWVAHPGGVIDYTVNITDRDDAARVTSHLALFRVGPDGDVVPGYSEHCRRGTLPNGPIRTALLENCELLLEPGILFAQGFDFFVHRGHRAHIRFTSTTGNAAPAAAAARRTVEQRCRLPNGDSQDKGCTTSRRTARSTAS